MEPNQKRASNTLMGILAYLGILVVIPLIMEAKNDTFVKFHVKQGLVLLICEVIGYVIFSMSYSYSVWMLISVLKLVFLVFAILGIINVVNRQMKELPLIGQFAKNFKF